MPAKKTLQSLRVRGPLMLDGSVSVSGVPLVEFREYVALLSQSGVSAPAATVVKNSLGGDLVWSRDGSGYYSAYLASAFPAGKVICFSSMGWLEFEGFERYATLLRNSDNAIALKIWDRDVQSCDGFLDLSIQVRVYK